MASDLLRSDLVLVKEHDPYANGGEPGQLNQLQYTRTAPNDAQNTSAPDKTQAHTLRGCAIPEGVSRDSNVSPSDAFYNDKLQKPSCRSLGP